MSTPKSRIHGRTPLQALRYIRNKSRTLQAWKLAPGGHDVLIAELYDLERTADAAFKRSSRKPAARSGNLAKLGQRVLMILEDNTHWNSETLDSIADAALNLGLATCDEQSLFKIR